jgi:hypothetical protein
MYRFLRVNTTDALMNVCWLRILSGFPQRGEFIILKKVHFIHFYNKYVSRKMFTIPLGFRRLRLL